MFFVSAFIVLVSLTFVSAYYFGSARSVGQDVIDTYIGVFEPVLTAVFGAEGSGLYVFERFLLFILLVSVIFLAVGKIPLFEDQNKIRWIVSIIISLIGVRFMDYAWLVSVLHSYNALAIAIGSVMPLIIYFFFVHGIGKDYPHLRKVMWILFIGMYIGLWITSTTEYVSAVYFWTLLAAVLLLLFDDKIERYIRKQEYKGSHASWINDRVSEIDKEIKLISESSLDDKVKEREIKKKEKRKLKLLKMIN